MLNQTLFIKINNLAGHNIWLDKLAISLAVYIGLVLLAVLAYLWFTKPGSRRMVITALVAAGIARLIVTNIIRLLYHHPRPFEVAQVNQLIPESGSSFPSGHASFFFALSAVVYFYNRKFGWIFFITSALMGIARVYVGVHWPFDIAGGIIVGLITGYITNRLFNKKPRT